MSYQLRPTQPPQQQQEGGYDAYNNAYSQGYGYGQQPYAQPQQQPSDMMQHTAPSLPSLPTPHPVSQRGSIGYGQDGLARTYTWVANQPPLMSPPPPTKTLFSEWTAAGGTDSTTFDRRTTGMYSPSMPPRPPKRDRRICGVKRNAFFVVLAVGVFLFVVGIAAGLGIGLGARKGGGGDATAAAAVDAGADSSSSSAPTTTPTSTKPTTPTSTKVSPTPSFTGTLVQGAIICPSNNNSVYVSRGSSKPFNIECGRDYNSDKGAKDLTHMYAGSMAECIDACGAQPGCVGAGWGNYKGSTECWLKSELGQPNESKLWYFAQLQDHSLA
ncbi:hypothetical protein GGS26DRAFT_412199 [Hypomontagnella submonticulosa]|nr:hypothetical protein GGS26DRAFT_412199 [Hypomontagnella submonticulosa]